jgi:hypothetical protein
MYQWWKYWEVKVEMLREKLVTVPLGLPKFSHGELGLKVGLHVERMVTA